ncbi:hypothetical protein ACE5TD_16975, partial [Lactiplantibacillus plantarum]
VTACSILGGAPLTIQQVHADKLTAVVASKSASSVKVGTATSTASQASSTQTSKVARVVSQPQKVIQLASSITIKNVRSTVATTDVCKISASTRPRGEV